RVGRGADAVLVGPQLGEHNAPSVSQAVRGTRRSPSFPFVLILTGGTSSPPGAAQLFDEVIDWPAQSSQLFASLARHLGTTARAEERYPVRVHVFVQGADTYIGSSIDLSADGMLLRTTRPL